MIEHDIIRNLLDAGCSRTFADEFMNLNSKAQQLRKLSCQRCSLLDKIHEHQKQLDCLDFLIYSMREKV